MTSPTVDVLEDEVQKARYANALAMLLQCHHSYIAVATVRCKLSPCRLLNSLEHSRLVKEVNDAIVAAGKSHQEIMILRVNRSTMRG